jgi:hypothetical protein
MILLLLLLLLLEAHRGVGDRSDGCIRGVHVAALLWWQWC